MGNFSTYNISPQKLIDEKLMDEKLTDEKLIDEKLTDEKLIDEVLKTCSSSSSHLFVQVAHVMLGKAGHLFALNTIFLALLKHSLVKRIPHIYTTSFPGFSWLT